MTSCDVAKLLETSHKLLTRCSFIKNINLNNSKHIFTRFQNFTCGLPSGKITSNFDIDDNCHINCLYIN